MFKSSTMYRTASEIETVVWMRCIDGDWEGANRGEFVCLTTMNIRSDNVYRVSGVRANGTVQTAAYSISDVFQTQYMCVWLARGSRFVHTYKFAYKMKWLSCALLWPTNVLNSKEKLAHQLEKESRKRNLNEWRRWWRQRWLHLGVRSSYW